MAGHSALALLAFTCFVITGNLTLPLFMRVVEAAPANAGQQSDRRQTVSLYDGIAAELHDACNQLDSGLQLPAIVSHLCRFRPAPSSYETLASTSSESESGAIARRAISSTWRDDELGSLGGVAREQRSIGLGRGSAEALSRMLLMSNQFQDPSLVAGLPVSQLEVGANRQRQQQQLESTNSLEVGASAGPSSSNLIAEDLSLSGRWQPMRGKRGRARAPKWNPNGVISYGWPATGSRVVV